VCSKNRTTASAPRRTERAGASSGRANQAGRLAVLGYACVCDRCGQMRTSHRRRGGHPPHSGRIKPPQKLLRPLPDSARVGFSGRCSCSSVFLKARFGGFSFFRSSNSLFLKVGTRRTDDPESSDQCRVCLIRCWQTIEASPGGEKPDCAIARMTSPDFSEGEYTGMRNRHAFS
jgi:hypothetical protein